MVRDRNDPGPWIPGMPVRFNWAPEKDPDTEMVRGMVQDGGTNLFVLRLPTFLGGSEVKALVVGFYPDELHAASWSLCDPRQKMDWQMGRMVVLKTLELDSFFSMSFQRDMTGFRPGDETKPDIEWHVLPRGEGQVDCYVGPLNWDHIEEIQRNNRSARADLKRKSTSVYLEQEIKNAVEDAENKVVEDSEFVDAYTDAYMSTRQLVKGNPRVSMYTGRSPK